MPNKCSSSSVRYARARAAAQGPEPAIGRGQLPDIAIKLRCSDAHGIGSTQIFTAASSKIIRGASWAASVSTTLQYSMRENRKKNKNQEQPLSLHATRKKQRAFPWKVGGGAAALVNIMCRHSLCGLTMKEIT